MRREFLARGTPANPHAYTARAADPVTVSRALEGGFGGSICFQSQN